MGYIDYRAIESTYRQKEDFANADGYADVDQYSYASGHFCGLIKDATKKAACEKAKLERKANKPKSKSADSDSTIADAIKLKASKTDAPPMGAGAIVGIIVGSLVAITVMVVVIKKVKAKK